MVGHLRGELRGEHDNQLGLIMATKVYMAFLALVFTVGTLAGTYHLIPLWLVWIFGILIAVFVGMIALTVLGRRILRGDFDPNRQRGSDEPAPSTPPSRADAADGAKDSTPPADSDSGTETAPTREKTP